MVAGSPSAAPADLVSRFDRPVLLHSEAFDDGDALLRVAEKHGLEGLVSAGPYIRVTNRRILAP